MDPNFVPEESTLERMRRLRSEREAAAAATAPAEKILVATETKTGGGSQIPFPVTPPAALIAATGSQGPKIEMCRFFPNCRFGDACRYSHGTPSETSVAPNNFYGTPSGDNVAPINFYETPFYRFLVEFIPTTRLEGLTLRYPTQVRDFVDEFDEFTSEQLRFLVVCLLDELQGPYTLNDAYLLSKEEVLFDYRAYESSLYEQFREHVEKKRGPFLYEEACDRAFESSTIKLTAEDVERVKKFSSKRAFFLYINNNNPDEEYDDDEFDEDFN
jgi:hypothetical protein